MREVIIVGIICYTILMGILLTQEDSSTPKVDLPEEYQAMKEDTLIGAYEKSTNTVHIWFVNKNQ